MRPIFVNGAEVRHEDAMQAAHIVVHSPAFSTTEKGLATLVLVLLEERERT